MTPLLTDDQLFDIQRRVYHRTGSFTHAVLSALAEVRDHYEAERRLLADRIVELEQNTGVPLSARTNGGHP